MINVRFIGDIGATYVRFAMPIPGQPPLLEHFWSREASGFADLKMALDSYLDTLPKELGRARIESIPTTFAVAGPVSRDPLTGDSVVKLTNLKWRFSDREIKEHLRLQDNPRLVNDFEAVAMAPPNLQPSETLKVGGGEAAPDKPVAIIGPGTGLGVAALVPVNGAASKVISSEGGHATLPANDPEESGIIELLRLQWPHVSLERVLSGDGLVNLYRALCTLHGVKGANYQRADQVTAAAFPHDGEIAPDYLCRRAFEIFCNVLGTAAGNLALTLKAEGGVYVAGGILRRFPDQFAKSGFRKRFESKGRLSSLVEKVPTWLIKHEAPALVGLASSGLGGRVQTSAPSSARR